jgi:hypothetical protein
MTKILRITPTIPRETIMGKRMGGPPLTEAGQHKMRDVRRVSSARCCRNQ